MEANAGGTFRFLAQTRRLGDPPDWRPSGASQLWRYHLHYWEWAWAFTEQADRLAARAAFARLWQCWKKGTRFGQWDEWSPYVVSVRTWVLCSVHHALVSASAGERDFVQDIALHARFVATHLERDVGGNHLIKNLKALLGAGVFLGHESMVSRACKAIADQLGVQVLSDGAHFERSPSYHCQVLGDLVDIEALLRTAGRPSIPGLSETIGRMQKWLGAMVQPDGTLPLLNDGAPVNADRLARLRPIAPQPGALTVLAASGYVIVRTGGWHLIADVGLPCPPDLPAHAHADTLSFVLFLDGSPVLVDTGTSEYAAGPRRAYERSTAAHNTLELDGKDSTEVWGAFRAGRRATATLERAQASGDGVVLTASHDGYRHLPGQPVHRRTWRVTQELIEIIDQVVGDGRHRATVRLHSPVACQLTRSGARLGSIDVAVPGAARRGVHTGQGARATVSPSFGVVKTAGCLEVEAVGLLPLQVSIRLQSASRVALLSAHGQSAMNAEAMP